MSIATGPDGNLWFNYEMADLVGRMTPDGTFTEFPVEISRGGIAAGSDGNIWFVTGKNANYYLVRVTPSGQVTGFLDTLGMPNGYIASGPDGNLWITAGRQASNIIVRLSPSVVGTAFNIPSNGYALGITSGPDGNIWFTEGSEKIGRITMDGQVTEFDLPQPKRGPCDITGGPDGNVWFTEHSVDDTTGYEFEGIGKITPTGTVTEFPLRRGFWVTLIVSGPDGNIWFMGGDTEGGAKLVRLKLDGTMDECASPDGSTGIGVKR